MFKESIFLNYKEGALLFYLPLEILLKKKEQLVGEIEYSHGLILKILLVRNCFINISEPQFQIINLLLACIECM